MTNYSIVISSSPALPDGFTVSIVPAEGAGERIRQTFFDEEKVLRQVLLNCLRIGVDVDTIISVAKDTGFYDLRNTPVLLSDECAYALGWIK